MNKAATHNTEASQVSQMAACQNGFNTIKKCADDLFVALGSCQLGQIEEALKNVSDIDTLAHALDFLGRRINSRDCQVTTRRISTKKGTTPTNDLLVELSLPRVNKILILSAKGDLLPTVIHSAPGVAGGRCNDSPAIFFHQFSKLISLPSFAPPPLSVSYK